MKEKGCVPRSLGSLEEAVMDIAWETDFLCVRDVHESLQKSRRLAYTTVMTTLDRLFKKGLLSRKKHGMAYVYHAEMSREEYERQVAQMTMSDLLSHSVSSHPVLAAFVDAATQMDRANLERLEQLIEDRKKRGD